MRDDFAIRVGRFDNLPQSDSVIVKLREKICRDGVLSPIIVWSNGEIIDGHTRYRIAEELGMHRGIDFRVIDCPEEEAHHMAFELNADRRQMTREERDQHIIWLRAKGWTQKQVAEVTGLSRQRVQAIGSDSSMPESGTLESGTRISGRTVARSPEASAAMNETIRGLLAQGLTQAAIAKEVGVSYSAISQRVVRYGLDEAHATPDDPAANECIEGLAARGYNSRQIGAELDRSEDWVRRTAKEHDIRIPADAVKGKSRNPIAASESMTRTVQAVADALYPLTFIDIAGLDPDRADEWSRSLAESANQLRTLIRQIKQLAKEQDPHG